MSDDDDLSHAALAKMAKQLDDAGSDVTDIEKGDGGAHDLAGALLRHLKDRLESKRETHGFAKKEKPIMESLSKIVHDAGFIAVAKAIADGRSYGLTETEFVALATEDAVKKFPDKTPDAAFARSFTDNGADGLAIRRAHRVVRDEQLGSTAKANRSADTAYAELMHKAEAYREAHPELSVAQCFEKIYCDRANVELAKRERQESATR